MDDWDPDTYPITIRQEIPDYDRLQDELIDATRRIRARSILELGTGSGETARRLLAAHPGARMRGRDSSEAMLAAARPALPERVDLELGRLEDPLPDGPFDLVVSALAVHHLEGDAKAELFERVAGTLGPGGRFALADLVVPDDPADSVTAIEAGYDFPSGIDEQLGWLRAAGLAESVWWQRRDLAVLVGDSSVTDGAAREGGDAAGR